MSFAAPFSGKGSAFKASSCFSFRTREDLPIQFDLSLHQFFPGFLPTILIVVETREPLDEPCRLASVRGE